MIKYFTFKKGQPVPMWFLDVIDGCDEHFGDVAVFATRGKIALNTETGATVMWAAKRHYHCMIKMNISHLIEPVTFKFHDGGNHVFGSFGAEHLTPLSYARRMGCKRYTSTKCEPLPDVKP